MIQKKRNPIKQFQYLMPDKDAQFLFLNEVVEGSDTLSIILKAHLYIEYYIDLIIKKKFKRPKEVLKYNFAKKVEILYSIDLLTPDQNYNIKELNRIRNKFAHNIKYDISMEQLILKKLNGKQIKFKGTRNSLKEDLIVYCGAQILILQNHIVQRLNFCPKFY